MNFCNGSVHWEYVNKYVLGVNPDYPSDPVPIAQEAGWTPGPVWTGAEILAPTGIRSPDLPART